MCIAVEEAHDKFVKEEEEQWKKKKKAAPSVNPEKSPCNCNPPCETCNCTPEKGVPHGSETPVLEPKRFGRNDTAWYQTPGMKFPMAAWVIRVNNVAHTAVIETLNDVRDPFGAQVRVNTCDTENYGKISMVTKKET